MTAGSPSMATHTAATPSEAEANVEQARAELAATLEKLKNNLRPAQLIDEVLARPKDTVSHWLSLYGRFAKSSPLSGLIIGAAALTLTGAIFRQQRPKSRGR